MNKSTLKDFLSDLTKITKKYKLIIEGCGCCGSPAVYGTTEKLVGKYEVESESDTSAEKLHFNNKA